MILTVSSQMSRLNKANRVNKINTEFTLDDKVESFETIKKKY